MAAPKYFRPSVHHESHKAKRTRLSDMISIKRFILQLFAAVLFLITSSAFILYAKSKVTGYLAEAQSYTSQLQALQSQVTTPEGMDKLQTVLAAINPIIKKAALMTYLVVPLVLFLLGVIFLGASFYFSQKNPKQFKVFMLNFAIISLIPFAIVSYLLVRFIQSGNIFLTDMGIFTAYLISILAIIYVTFIAYALVHTHPLLKIPKHAVHLSVRKLYLLFPIFLALMIVITALLSVVFSTYLSVSSKSLGLSTGYHLIALIVVLAAVLILKNSLIALIVKHSRSP